MFSLAPDFDEDGELQSVSLSYTAPLTLVGVSSSLMDRLELDREATTQKVIGTKLYLNGIEDLANALLRNTPLDYDDILRSISMALLTRKYS